MTDTQKLEAIKAEIERRKNEPFLTASYNECKQFLLNELQHFIATLDEQSDNCDTCTNDKGCVACENGELYEGKPTDYTKSNEEKAKEICGKGNPCCNKLCQSCSLSFLIADVRQMAEWKDEQFKAEKQALIEKACEWLKDNANDYLDWYDWERCRVDKDELVYDFKKAMEGGEK